MISFPSRAAEPVDQRSDLAIGAVEVVRLRLPYRNVIAFSSVTESVGEYVILRLRLTDGTEGIAESVARPAHSGEDATLLAYQLDTFFKPMLLGADPLGHLALLSACNKVKQCRAAKALIDIALWDLRGKIFGQPVWRLLGCGNPDPVPLTWIAHGAARAQMVAEARRMAEDRGYRGIKLKTWRRSLEDVRMVEEVRAALGDEVVIYVDGNGRYSESEAAAIFPEMRGCNVAFIEDPCAVTDMVRLAALAGRLPAALLGDSSCESMDAVQTRLQARAVGAVSVKLRRTGLTESLKIITLCEAAGIPVVIGTDSESRIGAMPRMHLRAALPSLRPWPIETHFFDKLADDAFAGEFEFSAGSVTLGDVPGFGAGIDESRLEQLAF